MEGSVRWKKALITGATAGIGEAFFRRIAPQCDVLIAVARRGDRLRSLADEVKSICKVEIFEADLSTARGYLGVADLIRDHGALDLLVNNAGYSTHGAFAEATLEDELGMVRLHQDATLALTRAALPAMLQAGRGGIINVASIAAHLPAPGLATYAATKAFLVSFSRSLAAEVREMGITVQCLCPGYTRTELHSRETFQGFDVSGIPDEWWMNPHDVVDQSLRALPDGAPILITGGSNRALVHQSLGELQQQI